MLDRHFMLDKTSQMSSLLNVKYALLFKYFGPRTNEHTSGAISGQDSLYAGNDLVRFINII
jgi:hypothetical protein